MKLLKDQSLRALSLLHGLLCLVRVLLGKLLRLRIGLDLLHLGVDLAGERLGLLGNLIVRGLGLRCHVLDLLGELSASLGSASCDISRNVALLKFSAMISAAMRVISRAMRTSSPCRSRNTNGTVLRLELLRAERLAGDR